MPPRRSARLAAADGNASCAFASLPAAVVAAIFARLPVDARLRCTEVCRAWRAEVASPALWTQLDLRGITGGATDALLRAAAARAAGRLEALDVSGCTRVTQEALLAVLRANAGALRVLRACERGGTAFALGHDAVEALLLAAPRLSALSADARCITLEHAAAMLRGEAPFAPLRLRVLTVSSNAEPVTDADVLSLSAAVAGHADLRELYVANVSLHMRARLSAVVDAVLARSLCTVLLSNCSLSPASAPELSRLLRSNTLEDLGIFVEEQLIDAAAAAQLAAALAANTTLRMLYLDQVNLWADARAATTLLSSLAGHPSLRCLSVPNNAVPRRPGGATAVLGALVAGARSALLRLNVSGCALDDARMRPLVDALHRSTRLCMLSCTDNNMTAAFARDRLLPAIRACTSLISLDTGLPWDGARAAEACARERAAAR
jgi:hypothetical protein